MNLLLVMRARRRHRGHRPADVRFFAERGSRVTQIAHNRHYDRMRAAEHAPRDPFRVLERRYGLVE